MSYIQRKKHSRATFTRPVAGCVEKPPLALARPLINEGALWNTMVFTVRSSTLWQMVPDTVPSLYKAFGLIQSMLGSIRMRLEGTQVHPSWYAASLAEIDPQSKELPPEAVYSSLRTEVEAYLSPD
jgi:mannose-1-phosphate guanylyltransferase